MKASFMFCAALAGCGGEVLQGADAVPPNEVPRRRVLAVFTPTECVDAASLPTGAPPTEISLIAREDGALLLVEARPGYDSLVVYNAFTAPSTLTFQAISTPDDEEPALREFRFDWPSAASGRLTASPSFEIGEANDGRFRAAATTPALLCNLVRRRAASDLDSKGALRYEPRPAPDSSPASPR